MVRLDQRPQQQLLLNGRALMTSEDGLESVFYKLSGRAFADSPFFYENYLIMMAQALRVKGWDGELVFVDAEGKTQRHTFPWSCGTDSDALSS